MSQTTSQANVNHAAVSNAAIGSERTRILWTLWRILQPFVVLLIVAGIFFVYGLIFKSDSPFVSSYRLTLIAKQTAIVGMGALGMTVIIISGGIDLSVGSMLALAAVSLAAFMRSRIKPADTMLFGVEIGLLAAPLILVAIAILSGRTNLSWRTLTALFVATWWGLALSPGRPLDAVLLVLLFGALAGTLNGVLVTRLGLVPFIVTLGTMLVFRGLAEQIGHNDKIPFPDAPAWLSGLLDPPPPGSYQFMAAGAWLVVILGAALAAVMHFTVFGRHVFAIGSNEATARLCGVNVPRTKIIVYALGGLFMALGGLFSFSYLSNQGDPEAAIGMELDIIAAVVIGGGSLSGGRGSVLGSIVGALTMSTLRSGCVYAQVSDPLQRVITGGIIIAAVAVDQFTQSRMKRG